MKVTIEIDTSTEHGMQVFQRVFQEAPIAVGPPPTPEPEKPKGRTARKRAEPTPAPGPDSTDVEQQSLLADHGIPASAPVLDGPVPGDRSEVHSEVRSEVPAATAVPTLDETKAAATAYFQAKGMPALRAVLDQFGVAKVSDLPDDRRPAFCAAVAT